MTNPNKASSDWLLRSALQLAEDELATIEKLDKFRYGKLVFIWNDLANLKIGINLASAVQSLMTFEFFIIMFLKP
jgi:hypothetical protein